MNNELLKYLIKYLVDKDDNEFSLNDNVQDKAFIADYAGGANIIYRGYADSGRLTSDASWQIARINYDGSGNVISIQWPVDTSGRASSSYKFIWDNRVSYTYA